MGRKMDCYEVASMARRSADSMGDCSDGCLAIGKERSMEHQGAENLGRRAVAERGRKLAVCSAGMMVVS